MDTAKTPQQQSAPSLDRISNNIQTYTSLQSLLVFQTLAAHRPESNAFGQIAQFLKSSTLFRNGASGADDEFLTPEHLQALFERTVDTMSGGENEENPAAKSENDLNDENDARKDSTPGFLAAELVPSLYEEYKKRIIEDIRAEERRYDQLLGEVKSLQALTKASEETRPESKEASPSGISTAEAKAGVAMANNTSDPEQTPIADNGPPDAHQDPKTTVDEKPLPPEKTRPRRHNASIDSIINHDEPKADKFPRPSTGNSSNGAPPIFHPEHSRPPSINQPPSAATPHLVQSSPPPRHDSHRPPEIRQAPSPRSMPSLSGITAHSPTAPVILPPPPGMNVNPPPFPPSSPYSPTREPSSGLQYRQHNPGYGSQSFQSHDTHIPPQRFSEPYAAHTSRDPRQPSSSNHAGSRLNFSQYPPPSPSYASPGPQLGQRGGVILPPFQVTPQAPGSGQYPQSPHSSGPYAQLVQSKTAPERSKSQNNMLPGTPVRTPTSALPPTLIGPHTAHLHRAGILVSPGSSTGWKPTSKAPEIERPRPRSISPISDREEAVLPSQAASRTPKGKGKKTRPQNARQNIRTSQSSPDESVSVSSQFSESLGLTRSIKGAQKSKQKPRATPLATGAEGNEVESASTPKPTKRAPPRKRKRDASSSQAPRASPQIVVPTRQKPADTVIAYRNFQKMAEPVMVTISSHKHGAIFEDPIREKQVEGYHDVVKRAQDLTSIRRAIAAGKKAVAAAVDSQQQASPGSTTGSGTGGNSSTVILPVSEALVPPKGIVNPEQLEQEIMRLFANAVMFNAGNDEIVKDTREMYESVEQALQPWRDVERTGDAEETAAKEEDGAGTASKRRRL